MNKKSTHGTIDIKGTKMSKKIKPVVIDDKPAT